MQYFSFSVSIYGGIVSIYQGENGLFRNIQKVYSMKKFFRRDAHKCCCDLGLPET